MSGVIEPWQWCNGRQRLQHARWFCCNRGDCKCTLVSKEKLSSAEKKWNTARKLSVWEYMWRVVLKGLKIWHIFDSRIPITQAPIDSGMFIIIWAVILY